MKKLTLVVGVFFLSVLLSAASLADGIIVVPERPARESFLEIKYHRVTVEIKDQVAQSKVDQVFRNQYSRDVEGIYIFPLPPGAAVSGFAMFVGGRRIEGEILDKDKARRIYEEIVRQMKDPALLEYLDRDIFRARIYPIPAVGEKRVQLEYSELLQGESGLIKYVYPLSTEKFSPVPLEDVSILVEITSSKPIRSVYSPTHPIAINRLDEYRVQISYEEEQTLPEKDFVLYYTVSEKDFDCNLLCYRPGWQEDGYFLLMISPKLKFGREEIMEKDICFVTDTSGSMSGKKIEQAQEALRFCINTLSPGDRFNIVQFDSAWQTFNNRFLPATGETRKQALRFVDRLTAQGGPTSTMLFWRLFSLIGEEKRVVSQLFFSSLTENPPWG